MKTGYLLSWGEGGHRQDAGINRYFGLIDFWRFWLDVHLMTRGGGADAQFRLDSRGETTMTRHRTSRIFGCVAGFIAISTPGLSLAQAAAPASVTPAPGAEIE